MISNYNEALVKPFFEFFKAKGLNDNGICGLLGNIYAESRLYPVNMQNSYENKPPHYFTDDSYMKAVDNGTYLEFTTDRIGWGICQWTSMGRKSGFLNLAKKKKVSIGDSALQIEWLYTELTNSYKSVWNTLKSPNNTVESCARIVMCKFECPKNQSEENQLVRVRYAQDFYNKYCYVPEPEPQPPEGFEIHQLFLTENDCYKQYQEMTPQGIVVHDTGCNNPNLKRYIQPDDGDIGINVYNNDWNRPGVNKCVHAMIGKDKNGFVKCYQTLPWTIASWGCGRGKNGSYNFPPTRRFPTDIPYIQFEILEDSKTDEAYFEKAFATAIELCAYLCKTFNLDVQNVVSHKEAYARGYASAHSDCEDWLSVYNKDMNWFRNQVKLLMNDIVVYTVQPGDTLSAIARKFKTTVDHILALNPQITNPNLIRVGEKIRIY